MHGYFFHIGDWMTRTAYCDWMEKAAYMQLLNAYYTAEAPFPNDMPGVYRAIGAATKAEKEATRRALEQFFQLGTDGNWHQKRVDEEIAKGKAFAESQRDNANARWDRPRKGKPVRNGYKSVTEAILESHNSGIETNTPETLGDIGRRTENADGNATAYAMAMPTINHVLNTSSNTHFDLAARASAAAAVCVSVGIEVEAGNSQLAALLADGATVADFAEAARLAGLKGKAWAYAAGIVANRLAEAGQAKAGEGSRTNPPANGPNYPMLPRAERSLGPSSHDPKKSH